MLNFIFSKTSLFKELSRKIKDLTAFNSELEETICRLNLEIENLSIKLAAEIIKEVSGSNYEKDLKEALCLIKTLRQNIVNITQEKNQTEQLNDILNYDLNKAKQMFDLLDIKY